MATGGDGKRPSNDLHTLHVQSATWRQVSTSGAPPAPRVGHSSTRMGGMLYIIGGFSRGQYFKDVHTLNVESLQWQQQTSSRALWEEEAAVERSIFWFSSSLTLFLFSFIFVIILFLCSGLFFEPEV